MSQQYLKGKTAIVTGAGKPNGIGAASAIALAGQGANVLIHYNSSAGPAEEVVSKLKGLGVQAAAVKADASSVDFGKTLVNAALKTFNTRTIDIIVNNAGYAAPNVEGIKSVGFDEWDTTFRINVRGPFDLIQAALPYMKEGGRVINIGSIASFPASVLFTSKTCCPMCWRPKSATRRISRKSRPKNNANFAEMQISRLGSWMLPVYCASKGALTSMTVAIAEELGPKGITANVVSPGPIATDLSMEGSPIGARLRNNQHIKREGKATEVAETVLFIASPGASYISGQVIHVDGGIAFP